MYYYISFVKMFQVRVMESQPRILQNPYESPHHLSSQSTNITNAKNKHNSKKHGNPFKKLLK